MKLTNQIIHSISWRLYRFDWGIAIVRAVRGVVSRLFPYRPLRSDLSHLATNPRYRVETGPSTIAGAGTGLFAREAIPAGEVVGEGVGGGGGPPPHTPHTSPSSPSPASAPTNAPATHAVLLFMSSP